MKTTVIMLAGLLLPLTRALALDYACATAEPQKSGWPLTDAEKAYVMKPEYERRPGREANKHLPQLWPSVPSAGNWGGTSWLDMHAKLMKDAEASKGPIDVLLVGDSITMQWGTAWAQHFPQLKTVNIGIGGDKTQNVLWRLDHGGVAGLEPRVVILLIGNNNMFFTPETGIEAAAKGIKVCADNLREKFPKAELVLMKIFPAHAPGVRFYEDIKKTNLALDALKLESIPKIHVLDLWNDFTNADGTLKKGLFAPDNIHLTQAGGYALYASKLKPILDALLNGKPVPIQPTKTEASPEVAPVLAQPACPPTASSTPSTAANIVVNSKPVLTYPYAPYNEGKMDEQLTGWPLTDAERAWVLKEEYSRKPGHEAQKHLPQFWAVTPTAGHWKTQDGSASNPWLEHHATLIEQVQSAKGAPDIALIGDSITQYWGGGWDGVPFNAAWQKYFADFKTVNLGIGGDRTENVLWRLDHGALAGAAPKVIVLLIGVNNAPLVGANGVPAASVAQGIGLCAQNLRVRCPQTQLVVVNILPAGKLGNTIYEDVKRVNAALDALKLDVDPNLHLLDLWSEFTNPDGSLKTAAYSDGHLHLGPAGYEIYASKLKPVVEKLLKP
jgi:lysophospholipase L1-like esterase